MRNQDSKQDHGSSGVQTFGAAKSRRWVGVLVRAIYQLPRRFKALAIGQKRCGLCAHWQLSPWSMSHLYESGSLGGNCDGSASFCRRRAPSGESFPTTKREAKCGEFRRDWRRRTATN